MIWHAYKIIGTAPPRIEEDGSRTSHIEWQVQKDLIKLGAKTIVPGDWEWRKGARGKMQPAKSPALQGYVVAGFESVPWHALRLVTGVVGCVSFDGTPAIVTSADRMAIAAMERPLNKIKLTHPKFTPDQKVMIERGPHAEIPAVVKAWQAGKVVAIVDMLGKPSEVVVDDGSVRAA